MWNQEDKFKVKIGGNYYVNTPNIIVHKGKTLFSIVRADNTGLLAINFDIFNVSGEKIAVVKEGRIYEGNKDLYTITVEKNRYTLIEKFSERVICDIKKRELAGESELEVTTSLYTKNGDLINATPTGTNIGNNSMSGCIFEGNNGAIIVD